MTYSKRRNRRRSYREQLKQDRRKRSMPSIKAVNWWHGQSNQKNRF